MPKETEHSSQSYESKDLNLWLSIPGYSKPLRKYKTTTLENKPTRLSAETDSIIRKAQNSVENNMNG